uniref:Uncharacterized protein n=1 Tax=Mesocestoides corti TaxID=53468 RepID=A0A5K3G0W7_MESCO
METANSRADWLSVSGASFNARVTPRSHVEYPSLNRKKTGTTEQALLTNQRPEPHVGAFHPSPPRWPHRSLHTAPQSGPSLVCCISSSDAIGTQRHTGLAEARCLRPNPSPHYHRKSRTGHLSSSPCRTVQPQPMTEDRDGGYLLIR